uniref:Leucine rich repeat containing 20 n=1 Tax=Eptatretus burgeri TaxID=7764 RepID=A0A8C4R8X1_EPTBU
MILKVGELTFMIFNLSDCKLICIPDAVFKMMRAVCARVQIARLSCNELPSLSVRFINTFSKLQELVLQGNQLQRLPDEVARMPCLIYIDLSRNKFQEFPEVVTQSASLQKICLQENKICRHKDLKVREVHTARITAGYAALSEVARPNISVGTLNGPDGGNLSGKKLSMSRTTVTEIRRMRMAEGAPRRPRVVQQKLCV